MGKFSDILLASDYDRTLTDRNSRIPQNNLDAIRDFQARGGAFTVATGRSIPMFQSRMGDIPTNAPLILYNGAAVYDTRTNELSQVVQIPDARAIIADLHRTFAHLWMEVQGTEFHEVFGENEMRLAFYRSNLAPCRTSTPQTFPLPLMKTAIYGEFRDETVAQFFRATPQEIAQLDAVQQYVRQHYANVLVADRAAPRIVDIEACAVSKGSAARKLAQRLGRRLLVCAGDAPNDLSMLEQADLAFVPADCEPEVRRASFRTAAACDNGTIADVVRQLDALLPD